MVWIGGLVVIALIGTGCLLTAWNEHDGEWVYYGIMWLGLGGLVWAVLGGVACSIIADVTSEGHRYVNHSHRLKESDFGHSNKTYVRLQDGDYYFYRSDGTGYALDHKDTDYINIVESDDTPAYVTYKVRHKNTAWVPWTIHDRVEKDALIVPEGTLIALN